MSKRVTSNQVLGEEGETAVKGRFLHIGFQFDTRSRLEAGIDGIVEVMDDGRPLGLMIAVQVKTRDSNRYSHETDTGFTYLVRGADLSYWAGSNIPVIVVLYRKSDNSFYWQPVGKASEEADRRLVFDKERDRLEHDAKDRLAALTVPKAGFGHFIPPLGGGEDAIVNILPVRPPEEMFVATTSLTPTQAIARLLKADEPARFDWVISNRSFWSFQDPRTNVCREIVDTDQVEAFDTAHLADHDEITERNNFAFLLRRTLEHQFRADLRWSKDDKILYFRAPDKDTSRAFSYTATKKKASTDVVNVSVDKIEKHVNFVRHHAFSPRFERIGDQWMLIITPTYFFTRDGFAPLGNSAALLSGKKRLDNSSALRGQVIMWHRFLSKDAEPPVADLFSGEKERAESPRLRFDPPPIVRLETRVPEDVWGTPRASKGGADDSTPGFL